MAPLFNVHLWVGEVLKNGGEATLLQALAVGRQASQAVQQGYASNSALPLSRIFTELGKYLPLVLSN